jgi:antitoxin CptB
MMMTDGKLRWQCKRGMRELDELLARYLDGAYECAAETEKLAFRTLLEVPDPDLIGYLLGAQLHANPQIANVIETIRSRPQA